MTVSQEIINTLTQLLTNLYEQLLIKDVPEDASFLSYIDKDNKYGLDERGYRITYTEILRLAFSLPNIGDKWSYEGLQKLGHDLLYQLAVNKYEQLPPPNFESLAMEWMKKVDIEFEKYVCFIPIAGMSVEFPFTIGDVQFLPMDFGAPELRQELASSHLKKFTSFRYCLASSTVSAEWVRACEIHRQRAHTALNVLRFISSLVYHDQPTRHIYVTGRDPTRVSYTITIDEKGLAGRVGASESTPIPLRVDKEFFEYSNFYGFDYILLLFQATSLTEIEESYLTAIQWYGEATQESNPLLSFVKYYVAIEAALKKKDETAKNFLPRRISVLLEPWVKGRQSNLEKDLGDMIDERNNVLHSGKPKNANPEFLAWSSQIIARQALQQLRLKIKDGKIKTKDDVILWVKHQYSTYSV